VFVRAEASQTTFYWRLVLNFRLNRERDEWRLDTYELHYDEKH